jgi:hypothetical protein
MRPNRAEANLKAEALATAGGQPDGNELDLYDELMSFTDLTPEQQVNDVRLHESELVVSAPQPEPEAEIAQTETAAPSPQAPETSRPTFYSGGITRAATISVYKSPDRSAEDESSNQSFIVLDAEELLAENEMECSMDGPAVEDEEISAEVSEMLTATGPLDVQFSPVAGEARTQTACRACGYESDGEDMFCLGCGLLLKESESDEEKSEASQDSVCAGCSSVIASGEIYCPSCDAVPSDR